MPFVFVARESIMTDDQVSQILSDLILAAEASLPIKLGLGLVGLGLMIWSSCMIKKARTVKDKADRIRYETIQSREAESR